MGEHADQYTGVPDRFAQVMRASPVHTPQLKQKLDELCQLLGWTHERFAKEVLVAKNTLSGYQRGTSMSSVTDRVPAAVFPRFVKLLQERVLRSLSEGQAIAAWCGDDLEAFKQLLRCKTLDDVLSLDRRNLTVRVRAEPLVPDRGMLSFEELHEPFRQGDLDLHWETDGLRFEVEAEPGACLFMVMQTQDECIQLVPWKHPGQLTRANEFVPPVNRSRPLGLQPPPLGKHRFVFIAYKGELFSLCNPENGDRVFPLCPEHFDQIAWKLKDADASYPWRWGEVAVMVMR